MSGFISKIEGASYTGINCIGYEQINVGAVAVGLTVPEGAVSAVFSIQANAAAVAGAIIARFIEAEGIVPAVGFGMLLVDKTTYLIRRGDLSSIQFISEDGLVHQLNVSYYH